MTDQVKISKFMSFALRHKPEEAGIVLDKNGWTSKAEMLAALQRQYTDVTMADLEAAVANNSKQRFLIEGDRIRANQGHSVDVDLQLQQTTPPAILYHGTKLDFWPSIQKSGLIKGSRQHVHLSADIETARIVANRRKGESIILAINTSGMTQAFYLSENGVWLTDHVDSSFISRIS